MSNKANQAKMAQQILEYDFLTSTIEFTKLCTDKCKVLKGDDDQLHPREQACLSTNRTISSLIDYRTVYF